MKSDKKRKKGRLKKAFTAIFLVIAVACLAAGGMLAGVLYGYYKKTPPLNLEDIQIKVATTYIYDDEGNEIVQLTGNELIKREQVLYKDIPEYMGKAFIAIEDERFESHFGVDILGIIRAVWLKITHPSRPMHGASTITMQAVRTITQQYDDSLDRKIQEWVRAIQLEKKLDKWQVLELYMNVIYLGNNIYGVQAASKQYYGKPVSELSLAQCALLAGVVNEPAYYDPFTESGRENCKRRQKVVLGKMLELGSISREEYDQAIAEELVFAKKGNYNVVIPVQSYFIDQAVEDVLDGLIEKGYTPSYAETMIYNHGLKIYTTQSTKIQNALTEVFTDDSYFYKDNAAAIAAGEHPQAAMVVIDPSTGHIKGIYGGYGKKTASRILNRASQLKRQPGSSIKPLAVYGPSIDLRLITAATVVDDVAAYMDTDPKTKDKPYPTNFDRTYGGLTTIRNAIRDSVNVVAAKVWMNTLGPDKSLNYLARVGIDWQNERYVSIALGGPKDGVSPLQMASAYVPFANRGLYFKPLTYTKVLTSEGDLLLENDSGHRTVYAEETAFIMTDMMKGVTKPGGTAPANIIGDGKSIPTAGKTGTTSENIDKWFVGFTPYYVAATWYGYDNRTSQIAIAAGEERTKANQIWTAVMNKIHEGLPAKDFAVPSGIVKRDICIYSGKIASDLCARDPRGSAVRSEYFISGTEPGYGQICSTHVKVKVCSAAKDALGRQLLANPYCPAATVTEKILIRRTTPYYPTMPSELFPLDWKYEVSTNENCSVHEAPPVITDPTDDDDDWDWDWGWDDEEILE